jgi:hypothetical protein
MLLNATTDDDVKVMPPVQNAKKPKLRPFARMVVGKISAAQMTLGASTYCKCLNIKSIRTTFDAYLEEHDEKEKKQDGGSVSTLVICAEILPLKKCLYKETASKCRKANNYPQLAYTLEKEPYEEDWMG